LGLLEHFARPGLCALDLGTGSGILAIAAAKQGVNPLLALDNDPVAVEVARQNATHNNIHNTVQIVTVTSAPGELARWLAEPRPEPLLQPPFDLIVANIIADVLIEFAHDFAQLLATGGTLISSGIIQDREDEVALSLAAAGLRQQERHREGEWIALVHTQERGEGI
jgi:ribosomal protein L11 methyltransferase